MITLFEILCAPFILIFALCTFGILLLPFATAGVLIYVFILFLITSYQSFRKGKKNDATGK